MNKDLHAFEPSRKVLYDHKCMQVQANFLIGRLTKVAGKITLIYWKPV